VFWPSLTSVPLELISTNSNQLQGFCLTNSLVHLESTAHLDRHARQSAGQCGVDQANEALHARLDEIELDKEARCVILAGAGNKAFCAGGDLPKRRTSDARGLQGVPGAGQKDAHARKFLTSDHRRYHGYSIGGAPHWLACDIRIAADDTVFRAADAYIAWCQAGEWTDRLRLRRRNRALDILLLGYDFDAKTAYDFGLVTKVVAKADLAKEAMIARTHRQCVAVCHPGHREAIAFNSRESWKDMVDFEVEVCERVFAHPMRTKDPRHSPRSASLVRSSMMAFAACSSEVDRYRRSIREGRPDSMRQGAGIRRI